MGDNFNEMLEADGSVRPHYAILHKWLETQTPANLRAKIREAESIFRRLGITFAVYGTEEASERLIPFDSIPRIFAASEWRRLEAGIAQRVGALNAFIDDVYHRQEIVRAGKVPAELILQNEAYMPQMAGHSPARNVYSHIIGTDIVRVGENEFYVLEDNCRTPSGVSYMLENRGVTKRIFPELFHNQIILPVDDYPAQLYETLAELTPRVGEDPTVVLLTPGIYNSAYFEHCYLAQQMGIELVEAPDLFIGEDDICYMRTIAGPQRVDVIYRRIDDAFIDPEAFRPDSTLGVPGLIRCWKKGNVALANAPGAGAADDKVVYTFVPDFIKFYLSEEPILPNVPSYLCVRPDDQKYVLDNLDKLVVKPANESGGYGMLIGPRASKAELSEFRQKILSNPRNYMAQPTLDLSTAPILLESGAEPRHLDLRPFILSKNDPYVTTGGLTRVAMTKGSLVVNSSQGGGSKDTWIVDTGEAS